MNNLDRYLEEIGKLPDFRDDPGREAVLVGRMRSGDKQAELELIESTLRFIAELTANHCNKWNVWHSRPELTQEANAEVAAKITCFDPKKSSLQDFVSFRARVAFIKFWYRARTVRFTDHRRKITRLLKKISADLSEKLGREPTVEEISTHLDINKEKVHELQTTIAIIDLDAPDDNARTNVVRLNSLPSIEKDPFQLAEISELYELLIVSLGKLNTDLLLTYERYGTEAGKALYFTLTGKRLTDAAMRQHAHRLKAKAVQEIQKKISLCA